MQNLDGTVVATAIPAMARSFGADPLHMNLALTSYLLSLAVFIPVSGWMADRFGSRTVFRAAIAVFTIGSVLCGQSDSLLTLVLSRIVQGLGGAMMVPVGRLVLIRSVAKSELVAAMAWLTTPALIGPVVGPPLGGFLVTYADWRWIFYINVPIGILGIALVTRFVEDVREPAPGRLDLGGFVLAGVAVASVTFGIETLGRGLVPGWATAALTGAGVVAGIAYVLHARRRTDPVIDLSLLRYPTFAASLGAGTLFRIGTGAIPFLLPLMLQIGFGRSAADSGLITFASAVGALAMKPAAQAALRWFGFRSTLIWNSLFSAAAIAAIAAFQPGWPAVAMYAVLVSGGFLRSLQFTAFNTIAYAEVPRHRMSAATSLYATVQQLCQTFGISLGAGTLLVISTWTHEPDVSAHDFALAFLVVAAVTALAAPASLRLRRDAGAEISGHSLRR